MVNENNNTITELWDGQELKCTFSRIFSDELMIQWFDLVNILKLTRFCQDEDSLIWQYESKGVYSTEFLYAIVNFRGVQPILLPAVRKVKVPPRIQGFLWLFSQNKIMTCDNLRKRGLAKPLECVCYIEIELVFHLFFECIVARLVWREVEVLFGISVTNFESIGRWWL